ncbi:MarR family transcriptional regulator [Kribbella pittospori]|uniref:MarR family transcriptional regulator n=2 Tax=Kribbella pittospori TaxID=722689 RepID=A0A4R0L7F1_9ACTN|nr:MarR family transcriptional regulator [Kribbella pittospori]
MYREGSGMELLVVLEQLVQLIRPVGGLSSAASSTLSRLGRSGPQRMTELAQAQRISQPGMTQLVGRMEREGLVRRTTSTSDRRGVLVEATEAGLDLWARMRAERADVLQELIDRLDPQDQTTISAALPVLTQLVESAYDDQPTTSATPR